MPKEKMSTFLEYISPLITSGALYQLYFMLKINICILKSDLHTSWRSYHGCTINHAFVTNNTRL